MNLCSSSMIQTTLGHNGIKKSGRILHSFVATLELSPVKSNLIIDGGNVVRGKDWVILTDKIFKENPARTRTEILKELEKLFKAKPIIVPADPSDFTGHAMEW
jgi:agmatine deiminase